MANAFFEVFPKLNISQELQDIFAEVVVTKVTTTSTRDFIRVYIESERLIEKRYIFEMEESIVNQLFRRGNVRVKIYEKFQLSSQYTPENLLAVYQDVLYKIGFNDNVSIYDLSPWKNRLAIDLSQVIYNEVPLYDFQEEAVKKLQSFASAQEKRAGILVMPTGSGKTRTAVYFLLQDMISNGYQVIWLAHRHMLLEQAADAFFNLHPVIKKYMLDVAEDKNN